jgi:hypothetical protein
VSAADAARRRNADFRFRQPSARIEPMQRTSVRRTLRGIGRRLPAEAPIVAIGLVLLIGLEAAGRRLPPEWSAVAATAVLGCALVALARSGKAAALGLAPGAAGRSWRRIVAAVSRRSLRGGVDLRGTPRLERALPPLALTLAPVPWLLAALLASSGGVPQRVLAAAAREAFLVHWAALLGLWTMTTAAILACVVLAAGGLHDLVFEPSRRAGRLEKEQEHGLQLLTAVCVTLGALVVPPAFLAASALIGLLAALTCLSPAWGPGLDLIWLDRGRGRSCSVLAVLALRLVLWSGLFAFAAVATVGPALLEPWRASDSPALPLTLFAGRVLVGWSALGAWVLFAMLWDSIARPRRALARALLAPQNLRLATRPEPRTCAQLEHSLRHSGYRVRYGREQRRPGDLRVELPQALRIALAVTGERPGLKRMRQDLARRAERVHRRILGRELPRLLAEARAEAPDGSEGIWIGPQHWFELAASAPAPEGAPTRRCFDSRVGPRFDSRLDWRTRADLLRLCHRLEVDHLFVEHGVEPAALGRVLEQMFEVEDVFGPGVRLEPRHLRFVPGVRAELHELAERADAGLGAWSEPEYDQLSRARILHLGRDRGGDSSAADEPRTHVGRPMRPLSS